MDNKAIVARFVEGYQMHRDPEVFDASVHPDFVDHSLPPGVSAGPQGIREQFEMMHAAFEGLRPEILDQLVDGDKVITRKVFHGTHTGDFQGIAPTGRDVAIGCIDIVRLQDGRIIEHWNCVDRLGLLAQLGALPVLSTA